MSTSAVMRAEDDVEQLDLVPAELSLPNPHLSVFDTLLLGLMPSCVREASMLYPKCLER